MGSELNWPLVHEVCLLCGKNSLKKRSNSLRNSDDFGQMHSCSLCLAESGECLTLFAWKACISARIFFGGDTSPFGYVSFVVGYFPDFFW